jgi:hypothetical protein
MDYESTDETTAGSDAASIGSIAKTYAFASPPAASPATSTACVYALAS